MAHAPLKALLLASLLEATTGAAAPTEVACDVVVLGGNTGSLAAAITAAEARHATQT